MAPRPSENFKQTQPITTTLKVICEYYSTNTCLKELLQNADDAGASEIEYVLDTKSYTDDHGPLLHEALVDYHGPALLVRNNSSFTDEDFISLASVGDSLKRHDVSKTGKFGQGFNSVRKFIRICTSIEGRDHSPFFECIGLSLDRRPLDIFTYKALDA